MGRNRRLMAPTITSNMMQLSIRKEHPGIMFELRKAGGGDNEGQRPPPSVHTKASCPSDNPHYNT